MEELYEKRWVKAIGVDNFTQDRLTDFIFFQNLKPAVNMIECNAFFQREDELQYLKEQNIQIQAWSPLSAGNSSLFTNKLLTDIAAQHKKSVAQVVLRWLVQRGIVPVVKSANPKRMKENIEIFDFELTEKERKDLASLDTRHSCFGERKTAEQVKGFLDAAQEYHV